MRKWRENALKLLPLLLEDLELAHRRRLNPLLDYHPLSEWCFKCCLCLLEKHVDTSIRPTELLFDDIIMVNDKHIATLIHFNVLNPFSNPKDWFTQAHLNLLVDYHLRICQGSNYDAINDTFTVLTWLRGSPSTQGRKCRYIDSTIRFMGQKETCSSALMAACSAPTVLASVGGDDESLRERFSKALASVIMHMPQQPSFGHKSSRKIPFYLVQDIIPYLKLLCALSQEPAWQLQLHHNGHFDNCLVIADAVMLSAQEYEYYNEHAVHVAHILANIDASGEVHPFYASVQAYPSWPLILRAWKYIFSINFFGRSFVDNWKTAPTNHLEALPSLITYSRNRYETGNEPLIMLVEQICQKLDEEKEQREGDGPQGIQHSSRRESRALAQKVKVLLESAQRDARVGDRTIYSGRY